MSVTFGRSLEVFWNSAYYLHSCTFSPEVELKALPTSIVKKQITPAARISWSMGSNPITAQLWEAELHPYN